MAIARHVGEGGIRPILIHAQPERFWGGSKVILSLGLVLSNSCVDGRVTPKPIRHDLVSLSDHTLHLNSKRNARDKTFWKILKLDSLLLDYYDFFPPKGA